MKHLWAIILIFITFEVCAKSMATQESLSLAKLNYLDQASPHLNEQEWHLLSPQNSGFHGISFFNTPFLNFKNEVIVAVIDSGFDVTHPGFNDTLWQNLGEIPNNSLDDDQNGYVDDIHGYNFLARGTQNILYDSISDVRQLQRLEIIKTQRVLTSEEDRLYLLLKNENLKQRRKTLRNLNETQIALNNIRQHLQLLARNGYTNINKHNINNIEIPNASEAVINAINELKEFFESDVSLQILEQNIRDLVIERDIIYNPQYNLNTDINYLTGNHQLKVPHSIHGTHVAGVIARMIKHAQASNIKIMLLRAIPNEGDERDIIVARAINYAVKNGAKVINMSFAKIYPDNSIVIGRALINAKNAGVIFVHAGGNEGSNLDVGLPIPNPKMVTDNLKNIWIEVGSSRPNDNNSIISYFSNIGRHNLDFFAPGEKIYSLMPDNKYGELSGTSVAVPIVAAGAALLWSMSPELMPQELTQLIKNNVRKYPANLRLEEMSSFGGIFDFNLCQLAL